MVASVVETMLLLPSKTIIFDGDHLSPRVDGEGARGVYLQLAGHLCNAALRDGIRLGPLGHPEQAESGCNKDHDQTLRFRQHDAPPMVKKGERNGPKERKLVTASACSVFRKV
jgi:hypothetical protein